MMRMKVFKKITTIFYFLILLQSLDCSAMDFDEGMIKIRSFDDFCKFYESASKDCGRAIVAYKVSRFCPFYSKGCPLLDANDEAIITRSDSFLRVHYALIQKTGECGVSIDEILSPRMWYEFMPLLACDHQKESPEQPMHIVSLKDARKSYGHNFVFDECEYLHESKFHGPTRFRCSKRVYKHY